MTIIVAACVLLTIGLFAYIFLIPERIESGEEKTRLAYLRERKDVVYENLRDLNFEYKAGKFPEADYVAMRNNLEEEAVALLAEIEDLENDGHAPQGARA